MEPNKKKAGLAAYIDSVKNKTPFDATKLGIAVNTVKGIPAAGWQVGKDIVQGTASSLFGVGLSAGNAINTALGRDITTEYQPTGKFEKAVLGGGPVKDTATQVAENEMFLRDHGFDKSALPIAFGGTIGLTALDATPAGALEKTSGKTILTAAEKLLEVVKTAKKTRPAIETAYTAERAARATKVADTFANSSGEGAYRQALGQLSGELAPQKPVLGDVRGMLEQKDIDDLFTQIQRHIPFRDYDKISASDGLSKLLSGAVPPPSQLSLMEDVFGSSLIKEVMKNRPALTKFKDAITEVINVPRSLMTSLDFSAPFRQGAVLTVSRPKQSIPAFGNMFKMAFSQKNFDEYMTNLKNSPEWKVFKDTGLYIAEPGKVALDAKEEAFMTNLAEKIPIWGRLVKGSNRAYVGYLNKLRVDTFKALSSKFAKDGLATPENLTGLANFINNATGRGSLGALSRVSQQLNNVFFSPRLIASRFNMLNPIWYAKMPAPVRKEAIKSFAEFVGVGTTVLALASMAGAKVELDPRSTDFGKIRVGNTRWDIWGGFQQWARLFAQVASGERKTSTGKMQKLNGKGFPGESRLDVANRFIRGKLAPVPGLVLELLDGQKLYGGDVSLKEEAVSNILPLYLQDIDEAFKEFGPDAFFSVVLPSAFGVGTQTYGDTSGEGLDAYSKGQKKTSSASPEGLDDYINSLGI